MFMRVSLKSLNFRETIVMGLTSRMAKKTANRSTTQKLWRMAICSDAAGMKPRPPRNDNERRRIVGSARSNGVKRLLGSDYDIARLAAQYGVVTRKEYIKLRNENEEARMLLPGSRTVEFRYGTWSRFAYEIKKYNADLVITEYVRKSAECGHWLRLHECDKMKIPIRGIMDLLRSRVFNSLCYRKLKALGLESNIGEYSGNASAGEEPGRSGSEV